MKTSEKIASVLAGAVIAINSGCSTGPSDKDVAKELATIQAQSAPATRIPDYKTATPSPSDITLNGVKVGTIDPREENRHCSFYAETGTKNQATWKIGVPSEGTLIVGGSTVDGKQAVLKAFEPGIQNVSVEDGFACVTATSWAEKEFKFRQQEAQANGWKYNTVTGLQSWEPLAPTQGGNCVPNLAHTNGGGCESIPTPVTTSIPISPTTDSSSVRRETGINKSGSFKKNEIVQGVRITLENGKIFQNCRLDNSPTDGKLFTGVVNPTNQEKASMKPC